MKVARGVNAFFEYSTQVMKVLLDIQNEGKIAQYAKQLFGVKTLQDVVTRWWSTFVLIEAPSLAEACNQDS